MYGGISPLEEVGPVETHLGTYAQEIELKISVMRSI